MSGFGVIYENAVIEGTYEYISGPFVFDERLEKVVGQVFLAFCPYVSDDLPCAEVKYHQASIFKGKPELVL